MLMFPSGNACRSVHHLHWAWFVQMLHVKALEQKALESELARNSSENDKVYSDAINTGEIMLTDFCETMERELQCSICTELFIKVFLS